MGRLLIVGVDSTIGSDLAQLMESKGWEIIGTTRHKSGSDVSRIFLDLKNVGGISLSPLLRNLDAVVFCAGVTSTEQCEHSPSETESINVQSVIVLTDMLREMNNHLHVVALSSSLVFDGSKPFFKLSDRPSPVLQYGKQKVLLEAEITARVKHSTIIRLTKVLTKRTAVFTRMLSQLKLGERCFPYNNVYLSPLSVRFASQIIAHVIDHRRVGMFQASACDEISYEQGLRFLATKFGFAQELIVSTSKEIPGSSFGRGSFNSLDYRSLLDVGFEPPTSLTTMAEVWEILD